jgi:2-oxoglutarate dehydrogenase E1 component
MSALPEKEYPPKPTRLAGVPLHEDPAASVLLDYTSAGTSLVAAFRTHGHLAAALDPLGTRPAGDPALEPEYHGLTDEALQMVPARALRVYVPGETLADALPHLREIYCGTVAYEIEHLSSHEQRRWLREAIESRRFWVPTRVEEKKRLLIRLLRIEMLEQYLRRAFLGAKTFSIEGLDMMILMLDESVAMAAAEGIEEAVFAMAHRGRLNVLAHVLRMPYHEIFAEFEGEHALDVETHRPEDGSGDVKYHHGAITMRDMQLPDGTTREIRCSLLPNPSHLEFVNPVAMGRARGLQTLYAPPAAVEHDRRKAVAILIHGDSAFSGQGIVAESLNLQTLPGYHIGGALHIIANNQIGFTTDPRDSRSTRHSSDLAKGFNVPIIHVNADHLAGCRQAARLAMAFRARFGRDVLIDLVGYRRLGHNEGDEPMYTQPTMYERVHEHPTAATRYAQELVEEGVATEDEVRAMRDHIARRLKEEHGRIRESKAHPAPPAPARWETRTAYPADALRTFNAELLATPDGFTVHPKLAKQLERRREAIGPAGGIDWAQAEALAFASLLASGTHVRLTGQDTERGTFSNRHAVLHDVETGATWTPMEHLADARAGFEIHNSPLTEAACLGFEHGYATTEPDALVLWEAQYGDFANGAQVIIDQFIVSSASKWGQTSRLTLLLPHGFEGNGPEHSSARLERFIKLAAEDNISIVYPTTPAQYFHLLRLQALAPLRRPLVVLTPKGLLRAKAATSTLAELADGAFQKVIDDPNAREWKEDVSRLVLCSGKIYYDLEHHAQRRSADEVAVARVERLYPFPRNTIRDLIASYPNLETLVWAQEEPQNMGAWRSIRHRLEAAMPPGVSLRYEGRPWRASPSEGYPIAHEREQDRIARAALGLNTATLGD